jgi:phage-related minor tail protein
MKTINNIREQKMTSKEYQKEYYQKNKKRIDERHKKYKKSNKEKVKLYQKEYDAKRYEKNKEEIKAQKRERDKKRKDKIKEYYQTHKKERRLYENNKRKNDINYKLACGLRGRLNKALRGNQKSGSAVRDLGCSIPELKSYLESKFQEGMTWENYGYWGWHIDHIIPLDLFDLTNRKQFLKACHYTNLQPLWAEKNYTKGRKYE